MCKIDHTAQRRSHRIDIKAVHTLRCLPGFLNQVSHLESSFPARREARKMPAKALQFEIDQLKGVSTRLDSLADQHPIMEHEIMSISGNVLSSSILLEVLLATKMGSA